MSLYCEAPPAHTFRRLPSSSAPAACLPAGPCSCLTLGLCSLSGPPPELPQGSLPLEHGTLPPNPYAEPTLHLGRAGLGPEPTVTISTRAAFEAINHMFGGGAAAAPFNQQQGGQQQQQAEGGFRVPAPRPPRTQAPVAASSPPAESPSGSPGGFMIREDTQFVSVPLEAVAAEAAPAMAVAAAVRSSDGGEFCIREDTQFVTVPAGAGSDGSDGEAESAPISAAVAAQASPAGGFGFGFCIREDTQFITVAVQAQQEEVEEAAEELRQVHGQAAPASAPMRAAAEAGAGGFCIREDTMFLGGGCGGAAAGAAATPRVAEACEGSGPAATAAVPAACPPGMGFAARDDTQLVALGASGGSSSLGAAPGSASPSWSSEAGGSTGDLLGAELAGLPDADGSPAHSASMAQVGTSCAQRESCASFELHAQHLCQLAAWFRLGKGSWQPLPASNVWLLAHSVQVSKWGFAPGADDTLALRLDHAAGEGDTQALLDAVGAASAAPAETPADAAYGAVGPVADGFLGAARGPMPAADLALQLGMQGLQLEDVKENVPHGECAPRSVGGSARCLGAVSAVLQPLGEARVAQLGVAVEADDAAEAALAEAGAVGDAELARQDSFLVWADPEEQDAAGQQQAGGTPTAAMAEQQVMAAAEAAAAGEEAGFMTPLAAQAVVDPFSPTFHARMLGCLEPAVSQVGVGPCSALPAAGLLGPIWQR